MARGYAREVMKQTRVAFLMEYGYPLDVRSFETFPQGTLEGRGRPRGSPASLSPHLVTIASASCDRSVTLRRLLELDVLIEPLPRGTLVRAVDAG